MVAVVPITHEIYLKHKVLVVRWRGPVSDDLLLPSYERAYGDPLWQPQFAELADLRGADMTQITTSGLRRLMAHLEPLYQGIDHDAAVVAPTDLNFGLARLYEMESSESSQTTRVFRDFSEAVTWLGIDAAFIDELSHCEED